MTSRTPKPPGTQIKSRSGEVANVCVGTRLRPQSLGTGASDLAMMCIFDCGSLERTCKGPVKSSWVNCGKITKPTLKRDILSSARFKACTKLSRRCAEGAGEGTVHAAQRAKSALESDAFDVVTCFEQPSAR